MASHSGREDEPAAKRPRSDSQTFYAASSTLSGSDSEDERPSFGGPGFIGAGMGDLSRDDDSKTSSNLPPADVAKSFVVSGDKDQPVYTNFATKLMAKMGYKEGKGLGRFGQGRTEIVEASKQRGRRGLGLSLGNFEPSDVKWKFEDEVVSAKETIEWMPECQDALPSKEVMMSWVKEGPKSLEVLPESEFCENQIVDDVIKCKSVFDELESEEMRRARTRSNPYETIRGVFFQNRAAMKMANMDAVCDFMFTNPKTKDGHSLVAPDELLYFADVCAGPGGFSEYILWRKKCDTKGFGFTLRGPCDFKLEEFFSAPSECFEPHYGVGGLEGDGDVYRPENQDAFRQFVMDNTDNKGVHFVMADGGFSVEGQENLQEILSKRLYLCQFTCALSILREGGHFVCKLFDVFTIWSAGLIYLMYKVFDQVSIFKPVTSRPANSERYIVCKGMKPEAKQLHSFFYDVNVRLDSIWGATSQRDLVEIVPLQVLQSDQLFFNYLVNSNEELGIQQTISLAKIQAFAQNTTLYETRQASIREECLELWKIPDELRTAPNKGEPAFKKFQAHLKDDDESMFSNQPELLFSHNLSTCVKSVYNYRCYLSGSDKTWYLFSLGRSHVFKWDGQPRTKWSKLDDVKIELPMETIVQAEFVQELRGEGKGQRKMNTVHIIDAMMLCGQDIRHLHYNERIEKIKKFLRAIHRPTRSDLAPIRVKDIFRFEEMAKLFQKLEMKLVKGSGNIPRLCYNRDTGVSYLPSGVGFIKTVKDPWMMAFSNSQNKKYFFNTVTRESRFEVVPDSVASFTCCLKNRLFWAWGSGVKVHDSQQMEDPVKLSRDRILHFIYKMVPHHHR